MQAGRFAEASQRLLASLELAPRAATAFNLAVALRGTGDVLAASVRFERLLAGEYGKLTASSRQQAERLLTETRAEVAVLTVRIRAQVPGAELRLDGVPVTRTEDAIELRVNPGARTLTYVAPDHESLDQKIVLARGEHRAVEVRPIASVDHREGILQLESSDRAATLRIEGHASGSSPLIRRLPPGSYRVSIKLGSNERTTQLSVPAGRTVRVVLDAPKGRPLLASPWFWISVGAAVVAVGVTTTIVATQTVEREPRRAPVWGLVEALEF